LKVESPKSRLDVAALSARALVAAAVVALGAACAHVEPVEPRQGAAVMAKDSAPGIKNMIHVTERIYSGSEPVGEEAFAALRERGVKTIVSADGKEPDVAMAKAYGMRYVHVPIGYDGVPDKAAAAAIRADAETDGNIYFHCHHGLHRGPALAAAAMQAETNCTPEETKRFLEMAGTSHDYHGLWASAEGYDAARLSRLNVKLHETVSSGGMHDAMARIDRGWESVGACREAGWKAPARHPDIDPAHEALMLREAFREAARVDRKKRTDEFDAWLKEAEEAAMDMHDELTVGNTTAAEATFVRMKGECRRCHGKYRD